MRDARFDHGRGDSWVWSDAVARSRRVTARPWFPSVVNMLRDWCIEAAVTAKLGGENEGILVPDSGLQSRLQSCDDISAAERESLMTWLSAQTGHEDALQADFAWGSALAKAATLVAMRPEEL